jgi:hypothetical protein
MYESRAYESRRYIIELFMWERNVMREPRECVCVGARSCVRQVVADSVCVASAVSECD